MKTRITNIGKYLDKISESPLRESAHRRRDDDRPRKTMRRRQCSGAETRNRQETIELALRASPAVERQTREARKKRDGKEMVESRCRAHVRAREEKKKEPGSAAAGPVCTSNDDDEPSGRRFVSSSFAFSRFLSPSIS